MIGKVVQTTIILSALLLGAHTGKAQIATEWSKTYGGNGSDRGHAIQQTADGGFIVSAYTDTDNNGDVTGYHGAGDIWVLKLDASGTLEWQKAYGGSGSEPFTEANTRIIQTADGGYLVTGESTSSNGDLSQNRGNLDLWVFKIDATGQLEWQKSLGGGLHEGAHAVVEEADGGFVLAGYTSSNDGDVSGNQGLSDGWLIKLSASGSLVWQKTMGGSWTDALMAIRHTSDGGYVTAGYTLSADGDLAGLNPDGAAGYADFWVAKLDSDADIVWQSVIGGTGKDEARAIIQTPDGGYLVAGETQSDDGAISQHFGNIDWWVVKLSATGLVEWEKSLGGAGKDELRSLAAAADGSGCFIVGTTQSTDGHISGNHGGKDVWMVKLDYSGNILLNQCYGGSSSDEGFGIIESADGRILITGKAHSDDGDIVDETQGDDVWVLSLNPNPTSIAATENNHLALYPNPTATQLRISETLKVLELYSIEGKRMLRLTDTDQVNISPLHSGTYILKAERENGTMITRKIIKQ